MSCTQRVLPHTFITEFRNYISGKRDNKYLETDSHTEGKEGWPQLISNYFCRPSTSILN
jgi:hypothetical protein